jgi:hypothetical protein
LEPDQARELKQLQEENARLKKLVADLGLNKAILQDVASKKWGCPVFHVQAHAEAMKAVALILTNRGIGSPYMSRSLRSTSRVRTRY